MIDVVKLCFFLTKEEVEELTARARVYDTTMTYQIRESLSGWQFIQNQWAAGKKILVEDRNGILQRIYPRDRNNAL